MVVIVVIISIIVFLFDDVKIETIILMFQIISHKNNRKNFNLLVSAILIANLKLF